MRTNYVTPSLEIFEKEIEDAVMVGNSGADANMLPNLGGIENGGNAW